MSDTIKAGLKYTDSDFSGYATKAGIKCADGRTITAEAFKHMDGKTVPLVWQHKHDSPENVLGHALLEAREDGVYAYGYFNDSPSGVNTKKLVIHEDIKNLSIYANELVERSKQVFHGVIRELSLVLSGANPGALIDYVAIQHGDGTIDELEDEAIIYTGLDIQHSADPEEEEEEELKHEDGPTVKEIYDSLSKEQKDVVHYMIGTALEAAKGELKQSDEDKEGIKHMNVFDQGNKEKDKETHTLTHDAIKGIVADADKRGSLKEAVEAYALQHGIQDIEILFPDAKLVNGAPEWDSRRMEWVKGVINGTNKTPFSRIKTTSADITVEEARARGYIKGALKKEEFFRVQKRTTGPTTVYKKQKLDRDDIIDITDFDVVMWMKGEMRIMLDEELARAVLIGDGRNVDDEDKIKDPIGATDGLGIRSILHDHELFVTTVNVNVDDADSDYNEVVESVMRARKFYKGSGAPTFYTTNETVVEMLLAKDSFKRRLFDNREALRAALMVSDIVEVEVMETIPDLLGIIVNLRDYNLGADKGGQVSMFDDFDIDYNQHKYLIETRVSGALTKIKSAIVVKKTAGANVLVDPNSPTFDGSSVTIVDQTGVVYRNAADDSVMTAVGSPYAVAPGESITVYAEPANGYYFENNAEDQWTFLNEA